MISGGTVGECDHTKCATCTNLTTCTVACHTGCNLCDSVDLCYSTTVGYYIDYLTQKAT